MILFSGRLHRSASAAAARMRLLVPNGGGDACFVAIVSRGVNPGFGVATHRSSRATFSNFTNMLQYQALPPENSRRRKTSRRKAGAGKKSDMISDDHYAKDAKGDGNSQIEEAAQPQRPDNKETKANHTDRDEKRDSTTDRPSWRTRKTSNKHSEHKKQHGQAKQPRVATSEWIKVSGIPPTSKLSDLFPSLNRILGYELEKGIIDLDAVDDSYATLDALNEIGASKSLYSTYELDGESDNIPLWKATSSDFCPNVTDEAHHPFVLEARMHLSYQAHPMGWFLRLPSRSVVHAILSHVRHAQADAASSKGNFMKQKRKEWREGLWKSVYAEYDTQGEEKETRLALHKDRDETALMWGEENSEEHEFGEEDSVLMESNHAKRENDDIDDINEYLQAYAQTHPYPSEPASQDSSAYCLLKSGSTTVSIREFKPQPLDTWHSNDERIPWDQHTFHLSPLLDLSDSVVRVETADLRARENDLQYWFRGYDLKSISAEEEGGIAPSRHARLPRALGWNIGRKGNVDLLVEGSHGSRHDFSGGKRGWEPRRASTHTFLVRFATPADARMAVRDRDWKLSGHSLLMTQYPR